MNVALQLNIDSVSRTNCCICGHRVQEDAIEFPEFPITEMYTESFVSSKYGCFDQKVSLCSLCGHVQLAKVLSPKQLYSDNYSFRTTGSMSEQGNRAFKEFIHDICGDAHFDYILEIGCNDTWLLSQFTGQATTLYGVDPVLKGRERELSRNNIVVAGDFFEDFDFEKIEGQRGLVISSHVLEHVEDPVGMISGILSRTNEDTLFAFQFPGFDSLYRNCNFHQIFHHHINYFSEHSISYLLRQQSCEILKCRTNDSYWGSIQIAFKKSNHTTDLTGRLYSLDEIQNQYAMFQTEMSNLRMEIENCAFPLVGYGAGMQLPLLNYHLKNKLDSLECIYDDSPSKDGLYYPNFSVPVRRPPDSLSLDDRCVVVTGINFVRPILKRVLDLQPAQIIVPRLRF
jgi:methylation protein EvaC